MEIGKKRCSLLRALTLIALSFLLINVKAEETDAVIGVSDGIVQIEKTLGKFAESPNFAGTELDSMNKIFQGILKRRFYVKQMIRVNSSGAVINDVALGKASNPMRSVAEQKWFTSVQQTLKPYYGTTRDTTGAFSFFWVWPATTHDKDAKGTAVLAAKINPTILLASLFDKSGISLQVKLKEKVIYKNNWDTTRTYSEHQLSGGILEGLSVCYSKQINIDILPTQAEQQAALETQDEDSVVLVASESNKDVQEKPVIHEGSPKPYVANATKGEPLPIVPVSVIFAVFVIVVVAGLQIQKAIHKKKRVYQYKGAPSSGTRTIKVVTDPTFDTISNVRKIEKVPQIAPKIVVGDDTNAADFENETKTMTRVTETAVINAIDPKAEPAIQNIQKINKPEIKREVEEVSSSKENILQKDKIEMPIDELKVKIYREIHGQITAWVDIELRSLLTKIEKLSEKMVEISPEQKVEIATLTKELIDIKSKFDNLEKRAG